jgi:hypothetical protein
MTIHELLCEILRVSESLLNPSLTCRDLPERRYISHGEPPIEDCDGILAVWTGSVDTRQVGTHKAMVTHRLTTISVDIFRCWPTGDRHAPSSDQLSEAALALADDVDRLTAGLATYLSQCCRTVVWRPTTSLGPAGGVAGHRVTVQVGLD